MNILEINLITITLCALFFPVVGNSKVTKKLFLSISILLIFLINVLRYPLIGTDMERYYRHFSSIGRLTSLKQFFNYDQEYGYKFLQLTVSRLFDDFQIFIIIVGIIIFSSYYFFIKKYSVNYYYSIFFFITIGFYDFSFTGLRQSLALAVGVFAYHFAFKRNLKQFCLIIVLASSFHIAAVVLIPVYFFVNYQIKYRDILLLIPFFGIFYFSRESIGPLLNYIFYDSTETTYVSEGGFSGLALLLIMIILVGFILESPFSIKTSKLSKGLLNILIAGVFIQVISSYAYSFSRLNYFYLVTLIIYIPELISLKTGKCIYFDKNIEVIIKIISAVLLLLVFLSMYLDLIDTGGTNALPYFFFWER